MRTIIDTGVFWKPAALRALGDQASVVIVPTVVVAERCRQRLRDRDLSPGSFLQYLHDSRFRVESLDAHAATRYAPYISDDRRWPHLARDALIAGHVRPGDVLWTTNPDDFLALGVPESQIHSWA